MLHVLMHMAQSTRPLTSEEMAEYLDTHPVVVRRVLAGLRELDVVTSVRGHGGGWSLSGRLDKVTLRDVYEAVGAPPLFAIGNRRRSPECLVERVVNDAVEGALSEAEALISERFARVRLVDLLAELRRRSTHTAHKRQSHAH